MHYALLSGSRTVVVVDEQVALRVSPLEDASITAFVKKGVIGKLGKCNEDWCWLSADRYSGWTRKVGLWGVAADEIRD